MISDIRVNVLLRNHRKLRRLEKSIGPGACGYLINLWIATAVSRPDGVLIGWTPGDIAEEVGWQGDPSELIEAYKSAGWVDQRDDGVVIVHDWATHQGWATGANDRSNRQRFKALIRHHGEERAAQIAREKYGFNPEDYGFMPQHDSAHAAAMPQHAAAMPQHAAAESGNAAAMPRHKPVHAAAESGNAPAVPRQNPAHAGVSAPSPLPSPLPSQKDSTKVLSGSAGQSKKPHFTKKASEYSDQIKIVCKKVAALSNGSKSFNPYQWVQVQVNKNGHPQAIIDSLDGLVQYWGDLRGEPWGYVDKIMKSKNGNYHERDETTRSQDYKKMLAELAKLIGAV